MMKHSLVQLLGLDASGHSRTRRLVSVAVCVVFGVVVTVLFLR